MAEIYLAETVGPGGFVKPLVIKTIHQAYIDDKRFVSMFTEEAKILSSLTHGNIVPIFDFGKADDLLYLAMEFIDGVDAATLMDVCRSAGLTIPLESALFIGIGTAAGLFHAHQAKDAKGTSLNIVHRDVSPQNILLSRSGEVKLCDFGLATRSMEDISTNVATNDEIKGKLRYLSPEQAAGLSVDRRSDLFSLGVVLYELIAGHHPVPSGAGVSVLKELVGGTSYLSLKTAAPWIPEDICNVIDRSLCFDKENRYQNAEDMRADLSQCLHKYFPKFSPESLAELVVRIQQTIETSNNDDETFHVRARMASFASSSRTHSGLIPSRSPSTVAKKKTSFVIAGIVIVVFFIGGVFLYNLGLSAQRSNISTTSTLPVLPDIQRDTLSTPKADVVSDTSKNDLFADRTETNIEPDSEKATEHTKHLAISHQSHTNDETQKNREISDDSDAASKRTKAFGLVNINASPWADIEINGDDYTTTPLLNLKLRAGKHKVVLKNSELGVTKTRIFTVKPNETVTVVVDMTPESTSKDSQD